MTTIRVTTLDNGMRIATDPVAQVATTSVGVWVDAGSRFESARLSGVSHFLEHMVFKGTHKRDARAIAEEIEAVGGHLNAHTSREHTAFYAKVLHEDTGLAIDILADLLQNATLDDAELNRERTVIVQEIMQAIDTPDDIVFDRFQETAFPGQSLGRPVLGSPDRIGAMARDDLLTYLRSHYGAHRMILAGAGHVDHERLEALAQDAFTALPEVTAYTNEPARYAGGDWRETRDLEQIHLVLGFEGVGYQDPGYYALSVLSTLLGGGMSSRLFQEVREKRGLAYTIYTFPAGYTDTGLFGVYAGTGADEIDEVIEIVCRTLREVRTSVSQDEMARARAQLRSSVLMARESSTARCEQLARQLMIYGRPIPIEETLAQIAAVDIDAVIGVAERVLSSTPTMATLGPVADVPGFDEVAAALVA